MSLSLFPIAPQAPGLGLGAAASPEGAAAAGFDALLAALFGETGQAQPTPAPARGAAKAAAAQPVVPGAGAPAKEGEDAEDASELASAEAGLLAAVAAPAQAPVAQASAPAAAEETAIAPQAAAGQPNALAAAAADAAAVDAPEPGSPAAPQPAETGAEAQASDPAAAAEEAPAPALLDADQPSETAQPKPPVSPSHAAPRAAVETRQPPVPAAPQAAAAATEAASAAQAQVPATETAAAAPQAGAASATATAAKQAGATMSDPALRSLRGEVKAEKTEAAKPAAAGKSNHKAAPDAAPSAFALVQGTPPAAQATDPKAVAPSPPEIAVDTAPEAHHSETSLETPDLATHTPTAETSDAPATARESARVSATPETVANLATQMSRKLQGRTTHFDIQLQPEGLGRVDVRVDIDAQGRLTAAMTFDNPQAAAELRGRSAELQRSLEQAGFDLSGGLSFQSPDGGGGGRFAEQQPQRDFGGGRAFQSALGLASEADAPPAAAGTYQQRRAETGVDIRI
ncbi:flagellar hook-length control protein FliK [Phenylobacterium sp.]|uniref:flagellar hook-length control protein FliK n=1 Tax=Phenylobacterium sp. TaxID=1871053 RepID=UPI0035C801F9